jgi:hypothetical protein
MDYENVKWMEQAQDLSKLRALTGSISKAKPSGSTTRK